MDGRCGLQDLGHAGCARGEERDQDIGGVEAALVGGAQDAREHLLTVSPATRPIAAATHLARDHRRSQRLLGAPIGGIERGIKEKAEDGVVFDDEVSLKPAHAEEPTGRARQQVAEALDIKPARDGEPMVGDRAIVIAIARGQRPCRIAFTLVTKGCAG